MVKRRSMVVGLGALATGSGAVFSSASFSNSVASSSDMRVVVEEQLAVEPGIIFRDGSNATDSFDPDSSTPPGSTSVYDKSSDDLFGGNDSDGLSAISPDDVPAAAANNSENGNLELQVAVLLDVNGEIGEDTVGLIQVNNETNESHDVAIRFSEFGNDVDSSSGEPAADALSEKQVVETYKFYDSSGNQISPDGSSADATSGVLDSPDGTSPSQTVANTVNVSAGATEQIHLDYDTVTHSDDIAAAADISGNPFNGSKDTVNLVDKLKVGVEDGNDVA
ncbi:hypothetical protein [Halorubrum sp. AS12]|uniref:hypothetical protein n=1 Tax=Halorubrum sp. AS12 TaxID=3409687 RepID=UPI003DA7A658